MCKTRSRPTSMDYLLRIKLIINAPANERQSQFFETVQIAQSFIPSVLYKFSPLGNDSSIDSKRIETLRNRKIFLSSASSFNDPFDCRALYYDPSKLANHPILQHCNGQVFEAFADFVKVTCLTSCDPSFLPMWAHYSNNHRGFCVAYDMNILENHKLFGLTFPVQYTSERIDVTSSLHSLISLAEKNIPGNLSRGKISGAPYDKTIVYLVMLLLNLKHISWDYEKEFRCSVPANDPDAPYIGAYPKEIYIGMNCDPEYIGQLKNIARALNIKVYKMVLDSLCKDYILRKQELT